MSKSLKTSITKNVMSSNLAKINLQKLILGQDSRPQSRTSIEMKDYSALLVELK